MMIRFPKKMVELTLWAIWLVLFGGAVLWLLVGSVAYWVLHGWLPEAAAGWVQAIGSVLALMAAVGVPAWQRYNADRDKKGADSQQRKASYLQVMHLITETEQFLNEELIRIRPMYPGDERNEKLIHDLISRLNIVLSKSDDAVLLQASLEYRAVLRRMLEQLTRDRHLSMNVNIELKTRLKRVRAILDKALNTEA